MPAGLLIQTCQLAHTALSRCPPLLCSDTAALCSLLHELLSALCLKWHQYGAFFQVNEGQLTMLNFPKKASTRQKLIVFLFLVDLFLVDLFTVPMLLDRVEE